MSNLDEKYPMEPVPGDQDEAVAGIRQLLAEQKLGVLSTCSEREPHASIIGFAVAQDFRRIYFATPRASRKYRNLLYCGRAALLIDNRSNQLSDFHAAFAVTATGTVSEPEGDDRAQALGVFTQRHPHLRDFVRSPSCALFVVDVSMYRFVSRFQKVTDVQFD